MPSLRQQVAALGHLAIPYFKARDRADVRFWPFAATSVEERWIGLALLASVIAIELAQVGLAVLLNTWNAAFFNALQNKDLAAFWHQLAIFSAIAAAFIVSSAYQTYLRQWLQIRWRRWMTDRLLADWLGQSTHYWMRLTGDPADNPDQRIAEDIDSFIDSSLGLGLGLLSSVTTLASFAVILWGLSEQIPLTIAGHNLAVPGYLVWGAAALSLAATLATHWLGRPLISLSFNRQRLEAEFRYALVRLRENSEQIAFLKGEPVEEEIFSDRIARIVGNWYEVMTRQKKITFLTAGYDQALVVVPYIIIAPSYFAGKIPLGAMTQTAGAFGQVQSAFSYFVNAYPQLAQWKSVVDRLTGFEHQIARSRRQIARNGVVIRGDPAQRGLRIDGLDVSRPDGHPLAERIGFTVAPGEAVLITGASGVGKTTLLRSINGLWPFAEGLVVEPDGARVLTLPQRPYLPLGTLRSVLAYPMPATAYGEIAIRMALVKVGLGRLADQLDEPARWSDALSLGEQQRIGFARALLSKPDILMLDEATSALDEVSQAGLVTLLRSRLPDTAILSIGHRPSLAAVHDRSIELFPAHDTRNSLGVSRVRRLTS